MIGGIGKLFGLLCILIVVLLGVNVEVVVIVVWDIFWY